MGYPDVFSLSFLSFLFHIESFPPFCQTMMSDTDFFFFKPCYFSLPYCSHGEFCIFFSRKYFPSLPWGLLRRRGYIYLAHFRSAADPVWFMRRQSFVNSKRVMSHGSLSYKINYQPYFRLSGPRIQYSSPLKAFSQRSTLMLTVPESGKHSRDLCPSLADRKSVV